MERSMLKYEAKEKLRGKWGASVLNHLGWSLIIGGIAIIMYVILAIIAAVTLGSFRSNQVVGNYSTNTYPIGIYILVILIYFALFAVTFVLCTCLFFGVKRYFLGIADGNRVYFGDMFAKREDVLRVLGGLIKITVFSWLWSLLLIIPGIIKAYSYSQTATIMADNPEMNSGDAIRESMRIMEGHKWELFVLQLSFIGWAILCSFSFGIGLIFLRPYVETTLALFYREISETKKITEEANPEYISVQ